ncbi:MAG: hypothetical protein Q9221_000830 [Calogaya cf. arnoldii]
MFSLLLHFLSVSTTIILATPLTTTSPAQLFPAPPSNPFTNVTILPTKITNPLNRPTPPTDPIYCIRKPRLQRISELLCAPILAPLIDNGRASVVRKRYTAPITSFGGSPCYIELRNSERGSAIMISDEQVGYSALAVLRECEETMGAGWGQYESQSGWYVFVYGDVF